MRIRRAHGLGRDEIRRRVDRLADDLGRRYDFRTVWRGDDLEIAGSQVNGHIRIGDDSVALDVRLGFGLRLMEGAIRAVVEETLDEHLA